MGDGQGLRLTLLKQQPAINAIHLGVERIGRLNDFRSANTVLEIAHGISMGLVGNTVMSSLDSPLLPNARIQFRR